MKRREVRMVKIELRHKIEKPDLKVGFFPIICFAPLIYVHSLGIFEKNGFNVEMMKQSGWSSIN